LANHFGGNSFRGSIMIRRLSIAIAGALLIAVLFLPAVAAANPDSWIGGTTGNWSEPSNWSNNNVAGYNHDDDVTIVHNDGVSRTVNFDLPSSNPIYTNSLTIDLTGGAGSATNTLLIPDGAALYPSLEI